MLFVVLAVVTANRACLQSGIASLPNLDDAVVAAANNKDGRHLREQQHSNNKLLVTAASLLLLWFGVVVATISLLLLLVFCCPGKHDWWTVYCIQQEHGSHYNIKRKILYLQNGWRESLKDDYDWLL